MEQRMRTYWEYMSLPPECRCEQTEDRLREHLYEHLAYGLETKKKGTEDEKQGCTSTDGEIPSEQGPCESV
tara:strand:- start:1527 stop:1739 length:213 start_codon:yes stop_codon:yes gene_type:complete